MVEKSRERGIYDELEATDVTAALEQRPGQFDLVLAADVFVYVGDLSSTFRAAARAMRVGGLFAFTVENADSGEYVLQRSRRYAHSVEYLRCLASSNGFSEAMVEDIMPRTDNRKPINGKLIILKLAHPTSVV